MWDIPVSLALEGAKVSIAQSTSRKLFSNTPQIGHKYIGYHPAAYVTCYQTGAPRLILPALCTQASNEVHNYRRHSNM